MQTVFTESKCIECDACVDICPTDTINFVTNDNEENLRKKWEYLIDTKGMRGTQDTRYAGGGIAGIRRPHAIPPKSGPMPQGGGLSSMFNRVRKW